VAHTFGVRLSEGQSGAPDLEEEFVAGIFTSRRVVTDVGYDITVV
jgi:hypothetical protein